ncbi:MAG: type II secretion system F family protein [Acidimicrobiia bacterium]
MFALAIAGIAVSLALVVYTVLAQADEKAVVRNTLRQLDGYEVDSIRDQELLQPVLTRAVMPVASGIISLGRKITPKDFVERVRQKLVSIGEPTQEAVDRFLAQQVAAAVTSVILVAAVYLFTSMQGLMRLMLVVFLLIAGFGGPTSILNRKVEDRRKAIRVKLPDILDLLVISVEAGLGFEQALDRTVEAVPGPLSAELSRMLGETRAGSTRADAMRALEQRIGLPEVRSFVLAILQADTFGVSIGRVLRAQADEMRIKRRQQAQERAMKAPVKMLLPMILCIFPALFVVTLGPAIINIMHSGLNNS